MNVQSPRGRVLRFNAGFLLCERIEVQDRFDSNVEVEIHLAGRFTKPAFEHFCGAFRRATDENVTV